MIIITGARTLDELDDYFNNIEIELSNQSISLIISARNVENFRKAAEDLIHDYCDAFLRRKSREDEEEARRICEYVSRHFAEYDLSIENAAAALGTGTAAVRQAILKHTGKMYKDYLIFLRIEYAKNLLLENLTVDETCRKVGYSSISYFTKLFKEITGVTPAKYKRGTKQE